MPNFIETIKLIDEFAVLPEGWHYGEGRALPKDRIETAKLWIQFFKVAGFSRFNAFPGLINEIRLRIYHNDLMFEVYFETDGSIDILVEQNGRVLRDIEAATGSQIKESVNYFINDLCLMSAPSIQDTSTLRQMRSQPSFLPREEMAAYRYLNENALSTKARIFVATSSGFTRLSPPRRPYTT